MNDKESLMYYPQKIRATLNPNIAMVDVPNPQSSWFTGKIMSVKFSRCYHSGYKGQL